MKKIKKILLSILLGGATAMAANPDPSNQFKFGDGAAGNKILKFNRNNGGLNPVIQWTESANTLQFSNDGTNFSDIGSGSGSGGAGINILANPGYESGIAQGWSNTGGAFLAVSAGSNLLIGKGSATFQAGVAGNFVVSSQTTIPNGLAGQNCAASMMYKGGDANLTFQVIDGSSNVLASSVLNTQTNAKTVNLTFICPSSGTAALKVIATNSSALIALDQMSLGNNALINISQAQFLGSVKTTETVGCNWDVTVASTVYSSFPAQASCPVAVATGQLLPPATKIPAFQADLAPGHYLIIVSGSYWSGTNGIPAKGRINNGTDTSLEEPTMFSQGISSLGVFNDTTLFNIEVSTSGLKTYEIQAAGLGASAIPRIGPDTTDGGPFVMSLYKYPSLSEVAIRADQSANSWSGYHGPDCAWNTSSTSYVTPAIDSACTFTEKTNSNFGTVTSNNDGTPGNNLPGIVFTPSQIGSYSVCAVVNLDNVTSGQVDQVRLVDGSSTLVGDAAIYGTAQLSVPATVCGIYKALTTSPVTLSFEIKTNTGTARIQPGGDQGTIQWTVVKIDQPLPAPILVGGVVTPSSGVDQIVRFRFGDYASPCSSGFCVLSKTNGGVASVEHTSGGNYEVTFNAGTFSAPPVCTGSVQSPGVVMLQFYTVSEATSTKMYITTYNSSSALADSSGEFICMGPK